MLIDKLAELTAHGATYAEAHRTNNLAVTFKTADNHNPVTAVDIAVGDMFGKELAEEIANGLVLIEEEHLREGETPAYAFGQMSRGKPFVLVDPVDGTKGFIAGNEDYGTMCSLIEHYKVMFARIVMPVAGTDLLIRDNQATVVLKGRRIVDMPADQAEPVARLAQLDTSMKPMLEGMGMKAEIWHSAAGMVTALALGTASFVTFPKVASLWDIAPALALVGVAKLGWVAYFAKTPETRVTIGAGLCDEADKNVWSLKDTFIVSTEGLRQKMIAAKA